MNTTLPSHPFVAYQGGTLCVEGLPLSTLAATHGTPLLVYSKAAMLGALASYQQGLAGRKTQICYAVKANPSLAILQVFAQAGCGFDIVSGGELARVQAAGGDVSKVIFSGVGKTREEMRAALSAGIACFNIESVPELLALNEVAIGLDKRAPISLRVNPNIDAQTHPYISTGLKDNKFGIAFEEALAVYQQAQALPGLKVIGIDCHIGSQITQAGPYLEALDKLIGMVLALEKQSIVLEHIDLGGGLGIAYQDETPPLPSTLLPQVLSRLNAAGLGHQALWVEPGRSLVGNAGVAVMEVLYLKHTPTKNFCIVNAAMNDLPRPALYGAFHGIVPVQIQPSSSTLSTSTIRPNAPPPAHPGVYEVVGPVCESGDWLGHERTLQIAPGDLLAFLSAGAYCMSMASNYNTRGRAAEILVDGTQAHCIRQRESVHDQIRLEHLLPTKHPKYPEHKEHTRHTES